MVLDEFNKLARDEAAAALLTCCGAFSWVDKMMQYFPFSSEKELFRKAEKIWFDDCDEKDWLEAFAHHPKIGGLKGLEEKFASTKAWAGAEQAGIQQAGKKIIEQLAKGNDDYEKKFEFIFIVCATGKTAEEMLALLQGRLPNNYKEELLLAMMEQNKITTLRLHKLLA